MALNLQLSTMEAGITWRLYPINFTTADDKTQSAYFYAVSDQHAQALLDELKQTAVVGSPLEGVIR